jgi:hypothetical protein
MPDEPENPPARPDEPPNPRGDDLGEWEVVPPRRRAAKARATKPEERPRSFPRRLRPGCEVSAFERAPPGQNTSERPRPLTSFAGRQRGAREKANTLNSPPKRVEREIAQPLLQRSLSAPEAGAPRCSVTAPPASAPSRSKPKRVWKDSRLGLSRHPVHVQLVEEWSRGSSAYRTVLRQWMASATPAEFSGRVAEMGRGLGEVGLEAACRDLGGVLDLTYFLGPHARASAVRLATCLKVTIMGFTVLEGVRCSLLTGLGRPYRQPASLTESAYGLWALVCDGE